MSSEQKQPGDTQGSNSQEASQPPKIEKPPEPQMRTVNFSKLEKPEPPPMRVIREGSQPKKSDYSK